MLDYYKGIAIYQYCSQLTPKKYILYLHLLFLYFVVFSRLSLTEDLIFKWPSQCLLWVEREL